MTSPEAHNRTQSDSVLDEAVSRVLASKSVPAKQKPRSRSFFHRASEGSTRVYSQGGSPAEPASPDDQHHVLDRSNSAFGTILEEQARGGSPRARGGSPRALTASSSDLVDNGERSLPTLPQQLSSPLHSSPVASPEKAVPSSPHKPRAHPQQDPPSTQDSGATRVIVASTSSMPFTGQLERGALWSTAPAGSSEPAASNERPMRKSTDEEEEPSFFDYLHNELNPAALYPTADAVWGQTERQRVYNAMVYVPYQLERLVWYGTLLCCDSFLAIFTVLPIRFLRALHSMFPRGRQPGSQEPQLQGQQLTDLLCVGIFAGTVLLLRTLDAGAIYFWMKDLTQEFLKLQVIYTAVEMFDKITCSFVVDSLEALSGTCTMFTSSANKREHLGHLVADFAVTLLLVMLHAVILMCQGMAFSVAMNSKRNHALVALIIATNFVEIKGTVFKRFDTTKLFVMTCQDVVERFHLSLSLGFVLAEEMDNSGRWHPNAALSWRCAQIFVAEIIIDVIKHAVLGKFNEIRPGVYREFTKDVCEKVKGAQSHNVHRIVYFEPFAPAALFLRIVFSLIMSRGKKLVEVDVFRILFVGTCCVLAWFMLCGIKVLLGFWLKSAASAYLRHYERRQKRNMRPAVVSRIVNAVKGNKLE